MDPLTEQTNNTMPGAVSAMPTMTPAEPVAPVVQPTTVSAMPEMPVAQPEAPVVMPGAGAVDAINTNAMAGAGAAVGINTTETSAAPTLNFGEPTMQTMAVPEIPVVQPEMNAAVVPEAPTMPLPQSQSFAVGGFSGDGLAATAPLTMPEAPKAPDPVEEELKAPLTPAAPVPGSIGSAISGPATERTPNVAFNDPAEQNMMAENTDKKAAKKKKSSAGKMNKSTLVLLCIVGGMVIIALATVLIGMSQGWF